MRHQTYTGSICRSATNGSPFGSPRSVDPCRTSGINSYMIEAGISRNVGSCPCNSQQAPQQQAMVMDIKRYGDMNVLDPYYSPWGRWNNPCKGCYPYQWQKTCLPPVVCNPCKLSATNGTAPEYQSQFGI